MGDHVSRDLRGIYYLGKSKIFCQGDQLNMAVFFWYLGKREMSNVYAYVQGLTLDK